MTLASPPSPWVVRFAPLIAPGGTVLDLACGGGRHARLLAARGHPVTAVDRDAQALAALAGWPGVETVAADLENGDPFPVAGRRFDAVVVTNYLYRPLFGTLAAALAPGGVLIYETFALGNERFGRPSNAAFLLAPGELICAFQARLDILAYEHGRIDKPRPAVVSRICAVNGWGTMPPAVQPEH